eukprot:CAMPEP_0117038524 /NCGR_PEP_ID=MMETSP0472-20121206/27096_1 /TAXON_ID=693140 ORGANISM="Tiarina fusus, Strain LIS" /NCGR_SAMPLE_ID=MMETSP0472 /ASSEMBLY_ACC=CAM_ASM_000603 /LENGTH=287 /DNA_ID=CAMNT_0004748763 /DNA_START=8 /DNA_END=867 /DNA_ORIENTATION=+
MTAQGILLVQFVFLLFPLISSSERLLGSDDCASAPMKPPQATVDFADPSDNLRNVTCGIKPEARGVWYRINGKGSFLEAKLTDSAGTATDFNTALFRGSSCETMECMLPSEYQIENQRTEPTSTWYAQDGESYFYHVTGISQDAVGAYDLSVKELEGPSASNDMCETAEDVVLDPLESSSGQLVSGNSMPSRPHGLTDEACSLKATSRGLFYSVEGTTEETIEVTLSILTDDIRLELAILTMGCDSCVLVSDFLTMDDSPHTVTFDSEAGESYVVVVSGEGFADVGE